jgi:3D (Asp-Asp-Asp) domain-containing protein
MAYELDLGIEFPGGRRFKRASRGLLAFSGSLGAAIDSMQPRTKKALKNYLDTVATAMTARHNARWSPGSKLPTGPSGGKLHRRSGSATRQLRTGVRVFDLGSKVVVGTISGPGYLVIHEYGGIITPRRSQWLTIPTEHALDSRGVPLRQKSRDWPNTYVRRNSQGGLTIFQDRGGRAVPLYVLVKRVKIPRRLGLGHTIRKSSNLFVDRLFAELALEVLNSARKA